MKLELYNDHFQNFKRYNLPKAQLVIADIPYNLGNNAYASSPELYKDKLPKFRNFDEELQKNKMIKNWFEWENDNKKIYPKIHPTQKPVTLLKELIEIFTDEGDVVIDPCAGSGSTLRAAAELGRKAYGFEK